jgi:hypothetical protein
MLMVVSSEGERKKKEGDGRRERGRRDGGGFAWDALRGESGLSVDGGDGGGRRRRSEMAATRRGGVGGGEGEERRWEEEGKDEIDGEEENARMAFLRGQRDSACAITVDDLLWRSSRLRTIAVESQKRQETRERDGGTVQSRQSRLSDRHESVPSRL